MLVYVETDDATGAVLSVWRSQRPPTTVIVARTWRDVTRLPVPALGWERQRWNGSTFDPPSPSTAVSRVGWRNLFTFAERAAIRSLEKTDALVEDAQDLIRTLPVLDRGDALIATYLSMLVAKGAITAARRTAILAGEAP